MKRSCIEILADYLLAAAVGIALAYTLFTQL